MRWLLLAWLPVANACWFLSKEPAVKKIENLLEDRTSINKDYVDELKKELPKVVSWAIDKIGVDTIFTDCDANRDGTITVKEMEDTDTCVSSCASLIIINTVL